MGPYGRKKLQTTSCLKVHNKFAPQNLCILVVYINFYLPEVISDLLTFADMALKEEVTSPPRAAVVLSWRWWQVPARAPQVPRPSLAWSEGRSRGGGEHSFVLAYMHVDRFRIYIYDFSKRKQVYMLWCHDSGGPQNQQTADSGMSL